MFNTVRIFSLLIAASSFMAVFAQEPGLATRWTKAATEAAVPFPEYPRPQLQRSEWMCLNGKWDYQGGKEVASALSPAKPLDFTGKTNKILVPYCPESFLSGIQRKQEVNLWYRRSFEVPAGWSGRQVIIHFDAVDHDATVPKLH